MIHFEIAHEEFIYHNYTLIEINRLSCERKYVNMKITSISTMCEAETEGKGDEAEDCFDTK